MIIKCPECELQVSDKALSCPHCGYPMQGNNTRRAKQSSKKHKRLPNGFGQITELKNRNLRNRFRVMITVGVNEKTGRPISKLLKPNAYFATYNDAYQALVDYNRNPYDLNSVMTVKELYEKWSEKYYKTASAGGIRSFKAAWNYCGAVYNMRAADIRPRHIKGCIDEGTAVVKGVLKTPSNGVQVKIKSLFNLMFDYALEYEIVTKNYARDFYVSEETLQAIEDERKSHLIFTQEEMDKLWKHIDDIPYADIILYQCYSGWRPQELGLIVRADVNLEEGYITGGMKTPAGTERIVPIHDKVRDIVEKRYKEASDHNSPYLFNCFDDSIYKSAGYKMNYSRYRKRFADVMTALGLNPEHKPHDPRKHFVTLAKKYKLDEYAIKYIVGHEIDDITENTYTEREPSWFIEEMRKIEGDA